MNEENIRLYGNITTTNTYADLDDVRKNFKEKDEGKRTFNVDKNGNKEDEVDFVLIDFTSSTSGYQGYAYRNKSTGEIVVVHEGSQDLKSAAKYPKEILKDWGGTNLKHLKNSLSEQFYDSNNFLNKIKRKNPNAKIVQAGQSLGGTLSQLNGALKGNEDIETYTYNALGAGNLRDALWRDGYHLSGNYSNISNFTYNNELLAKQKPHIGKLYKSDHNATGASNFHDMSPHQRHNLKYELVPKTYISAPTGGAASVKSEGSKKLSGRSESDEDGHWITKNGNHILIEDSADFNYSFGFDPKGMAYSMGLVGKPDSQPLRQSQPQEQPRTCRNEFDSIVATDELGRPIIYFGTVSPEVLAIRNDPEMRRYLGLDKKDRR